MKKGIFIILFVVLSGKTLISQNLEGNWILVKQPNVYTEPNVLILKITEKEFIQHDFNKVFLAETYETRDSLILCNDILRYSFENLDDWNSLKLNFYQEGTENVIFDAKLNFLEPTDMKYPVEASLNNTYRVVYQGTEREVFFNRTLPDSMLFDLGNRLVGNRLNLEKFENTLFLTVYLDNFLLTAIPIKYIDANKLILVQSERISG